MIDYEKLYHIMVDGAEKAVDAIESMNFGAAGKALIEAEQEAEAQYIEAAESEDEEEADGGDKADDTEHHEGFYEKLYFKLFVAVLDALRAFDKHDPTLAREILDVAYDAVEDLHKFDGKGESMYWDGEEERVNRKIQERNDRLHEAALAAEERY